MKTHLINKFCSICEKSLKPPANGFFIPYPEINYVYQKLIQVGMTDSATMFIKHHKQSFNGYCTNCWVKHYTGQAMLDEDTSDQQKISIINKHITVTIETIGASKFWDAISNPELN